MADGQTAFPPQESGDETQKDQFKVCFIYTALCGARHYDGFFSAAVISPFRPNLWVGWQVFFLLIFFKAIVGTVGGIVITCFIITLLLFMLFPKFFMKLARTELPKRAKKPEPETEDVDYQGEVPGIQIKNEVKSEPVIEEPVEEEIEPEPVFEEELDKPIMKKPYEEPSIKEVQQVERVKGKYNVPIKLLDEPVREYKMESEDELKLKGETLVSKLADFGVNGKIREIQPDLWLRSMSLNLHRVLR